MMPTQINLHGVLLEIFGTGVLLAGDSGIGKSECALDLITRGHRLVADDAVKINRIEEFIEGSSPELIFEHLEIRGLGIINVREIFGPTATCRRIKIELCLELKKWDTVENGERIGLEPQEYEIAGVKIAKFILPVNSGRNLSALVETAVRVYALRGAGPGAAQHLIEKHTAQLAF